MEKPARVVWLLAPGLVILLPTVRRLRSTRTLLSAFLGRLTPREREALVMLEGLAGQRGAGLYLVGGSVRDLLLGRGHLDLDFVVEADAPTVARAFGRATGARVTVHEAFRTAAVTGEGVRFDLVTARRESYPVPGALPVVALSTLADDLARRDFTVNAMALAAGGPQAGLLIDPHGGRADLAGGVLRVLHEGSFRDDATRLWRAGRYAARLRLRPDPLTKVLIQRDRGFLATISPTRIHHELERVLDEAAPERALRWLDRRDVLAATFPHLACTPTDAAALPRVRRLAPSNRHAAALAVLAFDWDGAVIEQATVRLELDRHEGAALRALPGLRGTLAGLVGRRAPPSATTFALDRYPEAALAAVAARHPRRQAGRLVLTYLRSWRHVRPLLSAAQLMEIGVPQGPALGELLRTLRAARLDGIVSSLEEEERLVRAAAAGGGGAKPGPSGGGVLS